MKKIREKISLWLSRLSEKSKIFWLSFLTFAESSFFPIPPDPFLMLMVIKRPTRWFLYSSLVTFFSVLGGILGFVIGAFFFEIFGRWIINAYSLEDQFETVKILFKNNAFWSIFVAAFTPIPYKVFTIASGFFKINLLTLITASIIGRGGRFFLVGFISKYLGEKYGKLFIKYFDLITILVVLLVVVFFVFLKF